MSAGVGTAALAGCFSLEQQSVGQPAVVENRPDAVYIPSHVEGMKMIGMKSAGDRMVGLFYSYAHRFWTVTGTRTSKVEIQDDDTIHLMASVWEPETKTVIPVGSGLTVSITRDGESIESRTPWPMLSQNMGFHFGDNFSLTGDGTYDVSVQTGSVGLQRNGAFDGKFGSSTTADFTFEYSQSARDEISYRRLDERKGQRGAVDPMDMQMPLSFAPEESALPGTVIGAQSSGDATFVASTTEREGSTFVAISPRTPQNRYVLPMMSLSMTLERDGQPVEESTLQGTIDPEFGLHYGTTVPSVESGDTVTVTVDSPPQMSRHEGYDTAFLDMPDVSFSVP
jgi:hypothetical protein